MTFSQTKNWISVGVYVLAGSAAIAPSVNAAAKQSASGISAPQLVMPLIAGTPTKAAQGGEGRASANPSTPSAPVPGGEAGTIKFTNKVSGAPLVNALRGGGYVIFFRHAQTEKDYADQISAKMGDCSTQRMLSAAGWQQAREIGQGFRMLKIPVGKVYSSQYCRAWQTADLAFGTHQETAALNFEPAEDFTPAQIQKMKAGIMPMLTAMPAPGTNTVLVGHDDVFKAATGIYPEPQGIAYIVKPNGKYGFELIANVKADEWLKMPR